jgi:hypothetical protein
MAAESECAAHVAQFVHSFAKLLRTAVVNGSHASAACRAKSRCGQASSRESHDEHALAF